MAISRGETLGLSYLLPENRYVQPLQQVVPEQPAGQLGLNLPKVDDAYANIEGVTDRFIDLRNKIEKYALSMQKDYKIDVTVPDISQPGGGLPFKTYQKLATDLLVTANDLKERMGQDKAIQEGILRGDVLAEGDYENQPLGTSIQQRAVSTDLLPEVTSAISALQRGYDTREGARRATNAYKAPLVERLQELIQQDPTNAVFYQRQIDALPDAIYEPSPGVLSAYARKKGAGLDKNQELFLRKVESLRSGKLPKGKYEVQNDETGEIAAVSKELAGSQYGFHEYSTTDKQGNSYVKKIPRIIDSWNVYPTGEVWLSFKQPSGENIPRERVDTQTGGVVMQQLLSSNPRLGSFDKLATNMLEQGLMTVEGSLDPQALYGEDFPTITKMGEDVFADVTEMKKGADVAENIIREQLEDMTPASFFRNSDRKVFKGKGGEKIEVGKNKDGYYIDAEKSDIGVDKTEGLKLDEVVNLLKRIGVTSKYVGGKTRPTFIGDQSETVNKGGKKAY